uniref:Uncharacterized protein n=1 Tax=Oryza barthii TaxID=65489 RepID=A0A0D3GDL4_9ORYZ
MGWSRDSADLEGRCGRLARTMCFTNSIHFRSPELTASTIGHPRLLYLCCRPPELALRLPPTPTAQACSTSASTISTRGRSTSAAR